MKHEEPRVCGNCGCKTYGQQMLCCNAPFDAKAAYGRPRRVIMPDYMLTAMMKQAEGIEQMTETWMADREALKPAAEELVTELLKLVAVSYSDDLEYDRDAMVARAISLLEPVRGSEQLRVRFENETDYALECHTEQKDGFLVLRLRAAKQHGKELARVATGEGCPDVVLWEEGAGLVVELDFEAVNGTKERTAPIGWAGVWMLAKAMVGWGKQLVERGP